MVLHALLTQHELDPLIGERNRQRWQKQNQLTPAFPVNAFGRKLRIFPAFALGQVVARTPRRTQQLPSAIEAITRASQRLYEAVPFRVLTETLRRHLHEIERPDALALSELLLALAPDALRAMQEEMEGIELALREHAVSLDARLGRVRSFDDATVMVELAGGGVRAIRRDRAVGDLLAGAWVLCDRVSVGTLADEFLLPALSPARVADLDWRQAALDELHAQVKATQRDDGSLDGDWRSAVRGTRRGPIVATDASDKLARLLTSVGYGDSRPVAEALGELLGGVWVLEGATEDAIGAALEKGADPEQLLDEIEQVYDEIERLVGQARQGLAVTRGSAPAGARDHGGAAAGH
jgi:hypothetical protein